MKRKSKEISELDATVQRACVQLAELEQQLRGMQKRAERAEQLAANRAGQLAEVDSACRRLQLSDSECDSG